MAFSETLAAQVREVLAGTEGITERRMFGGIAFLRHGHMLAGVLGEDLVARVGKNAYAAMLARDHVRPMDFTGRPMGGFVLVSPAGLSGEGELARWVRGCLEIVAALPPKPSSSP